MSFVWCFKLFVIVLCLHLCVRCCCSVTSCFILLTAVLSHSCRHLCCSPHITLCTPLCISSLSFPLLPLTLMTLYILDHQSMTFHRFILCFNCLKVYFVVLPFKADLFNIFHTNMFFFLEGMPNALIFL